MTTAQSTRRDMVIERVYHTPGHFRARVIATQRQQNTIGVARCFLLLTFLGGFDDLAGVCRGCGAVLGCVRRDAASGSGEARKPDARAVVRRRRVLPDWRARAGGGAPLTGSAARLQRVRHDGSDTRWRARGDWRR